MLKTMIALGKMQFKQYNIYQSNFWLFTLNRVIEVAVYIFVWQAIYQQTGGNRRLYVTSNGNLLYFSYCLYFICYLGN